MLHLPKDFSRNIVNERLVTGRRARGQVANEKLSLLVATCMASMPPLKAHKDIISCLRCWCLENGGEFSRLTHTQLALSSACKASKYMT
jgi:hypothetical protein